MHGPLRVGGNGIGRCQQGAGGSERNKGGAGPYRADADGARRIVAGAAGDHRSLGHSPAQRQLVAQPRRRCTAFDQTRHVAARQAGRRQPFIRPVAARDIEPQRSRGVRDILDRFTGQDQAQIGLRQQNEFGGRKNLRLVLRYPQQFGSGESGHRLVACRRPQSGPALFQLTAFRGGASVLPENAGPQRFEVRIEQRCAVHLARQADALDRRQFTGMIRLQGVQRCKRRLDPLAGVLFGSAGTRRIHRQRSASACHDALLVIDENGFDR
jgi:hypothetical protein